MLIHLQLIRFILMYYDLYWAILTLFYDWRNTLKHYRTSSKVRPLQNKQCTTQKYAPPQSGLKLNCIVLCFFIMHGFIYLFTKISVSKKFNTEVEVTLNSALKRTLKERAHHWDFLYQSIIFGTRRVTHNISMFSPTFNILSHSRSWECQTIGCF